jgi:hypothetical protein
MNDDAKLVCAYCDVYCRNERVTRDAQGREIMSDTCCAYCGRTEMRFGKLGYQTPVPEPPKPLPDGELSDGEPPF